MPQSKESKLDTSPISQGELSGAGARTANEPVAKWSTTMIKQGDLGGDVKAGYQPSKGNPVSLKNVDDFKE